MAIAPEKVESQGLDIQVLDIDVKALLPHRDEALMVDEIVAVDTTTQEIFTRYWVPLDSWWRFGHFPGNPMMPGVLITEVAAQSCALLAMRCGATGTPLLAEYQTRLIRPVKPGDTLIVEAKIDKKNSNRRVWRFTFQIKNQQDELVARGFLAGLAITSPRV